MTPYAFSASDVGILPSLHFDVKMTSYKTFIVDFGFRIQKFPLHQILARSSQYLGKYASFFTFLFRDTFITKGCHGTSKISENCHYVQNDPHRGKIKLEKFHFDILCCFVVIKESLPGRLNPPPPR